MSIKPSIKAFMNSSNPTQLSSRFLSLIKLTVGGKCLAKVDEKTVYFLLNLVGEGAKLNGRPVERKFQYNILNFFDCLIVDNLKAREIILDNAQAFIKPSTSLERISLSFTIIKTLMSYDDGIKIMATKIPLDHQLENIVEAATVAFAETMYILIVYCNSRGGNGPAKPIPKIPVFHWKLIEDCLDILMNCARHPSLRKEIPKWMIYTGTKADTTLLLLHTAITIPQMLKITFEGEPLTRHCKIVRDAKLLVALMMENPEGAAFVQKNVPKYVKYYSTLYETTVRPGAHRYDPLEGTSGMPEAESSGSNEEEEESNWEDDYNQLLQQYFEKKQAEQELGSKSRLISPDLSNDTE